MRPLLLLLSILSAGPVGLASPEITAFTPTLPVDVQAEAGLPSLSPEQRQVLDALIHRDLELARQGDVRGFSRSFTERRTGEELRKSGMTRLTAEQRSRLDAVVATAIADQPRTGEIVWTPTSARILRERQQPIIHGEVSMFYGQGRGDHSWYGGSFATTVTDPSRRMTLGFGYAEIREKGAPDYYRRLHRGK